MSDAQSGNSAPLPSSQGLLVRNTFFLALAQAVAMPLSIIVNGVMARHLGPQDFGYIYLASTMCSFGFLFVEWGQGLTLPAMVSTNRARSGELLGTGIAWRLGASVVVYGLLAATSWLLGYDRELQFVLAFISTSYALTQLTFACQDTLRGFERTDVTAYGYVGLQVAGLLLVVPTLVLGGRLHAVVASQMASIGLVLIFVWRTLRPSGVGPLTVRRQTLDELLKQGAPFLFFGLAMALQPNIDAVLLSKLAPAATVGWHAAARKLVGVLVYPAGALISALYPTVCRLWASDVDGYIRTARGAIRGSIALAAPLALGAALFANVGVRIFGRQSFAAAENNVRILSIFIFLVYITMPLGSCLMAAGRQRSWAGVQFACVIVSAGLDPLLVPWFQARTGNGGLGICVSTVASEILMVSAGIWLMPRGVFDRSVLRVLGLTALGALAMALTARLLSGITPFVAAPLSVVAYALCLWFTGGIDREQVRMVGNFLARKRARA